GERALSYHAEDVHDFAWMADPYMQVERATVAGTFGPIEVRVYHRPSQRRFARRHLEAARRTLQAYGKWFGPYPWSNLSIVDPPWDAAPGAGGMEYPTLVTTGGDIDLPGGRFLEEVTVHEVGHNWFQGKLASNEVDEAFLDEGLNTYANG